MEYNELVKEVISVSNIIQLNYDEYDEDYEQEGVFLEKLENDAIDGLAYEVLISLIDVISKLEKHYVSDIGWVEQYRTHLHMVGLKILANNIIHSFKMYEFETFYIKNKFA